MKNFYIEFDYNDREILLAGNSHNSWSVDIASANGVDWSDSDADESLPAIDVVMIVLATILFLTFGIFVCIKCKSNGTESAQTDVNEQLYNTTTNGDTAADGEME